jgi:DNA-binding PadR family transcriptional regulator
MKHLSRSEEIVLMAVWTLQDNAYGVTIRDRIRRTTGRNWSIGAIYAPLHRLEKKGLVMTSKGEPVPERGGRSKVYYEVSAAGRAALAEARRLHEALWADAPELEGD